MLFVCLFVSCLLVRLLFVHLLGSPEILDITLWWSQVERGITKLALCSLFTGGHWCCRNRLAGADMMRSFCNAASCCVICDPLQTLLQFFIRTHNAHRWPTGVSHMSQYFRVLAKQDQSWCAFCNDFSQEIDVTQWVISMVKQFTGLIYLGALPQHQSGPDVSSFKAIQW